MMTAADDRRDRLAALLHQTACTPKGHFQVVATGQPLCEAEADRLISAGVTLASTPPPQPEADSPALDVERLRRIEAAAWVLVRTEHPCWTLPEGIALHQALTDDAARGGKPPA